ncbi:hypothetical protein AB685_15370 [Bacillus sp. LL01]|uniref:SEC-C domain-containing protein n=1 Tax=Bacillus sp. LL01 TaxID=1665556 RepID=UPI00064CDFD2|nr:SEC-C domain-containing protein [Bacillus sp. LL01]KMJ57408.1 hypothetical protein AB685_15370 [Bacillus sp. LL01]
MGISRNQFCHCGSGKKYKKCCMMRYEDKLQEKLFYERKHVLTTMVIDFVMRDLDRQDMEDLHAGFEKKIGHFVSERDKSMMFPFFALFMHRFEKSLRGVEWFYKVKGNQLETELKTIAKIWTSLRFRLVHALESKGDIIIFEDLITKEKYPLANIPENVPGNLGLQIGTVGLLELHNGKYYFNGVRVFTEPNGVNRAKNKVESLMVESEMTYEEVMMKYTPEVLEALLAKDNPTQFQEKDIPDLEALGLEHLPVYARDFLAFYQEKTAGKKGNTVRKYRESLQDLNEVLKRNQIVDLKDVDERFWKKLLAKEYFDMFESMSKTQITDFISTLKSFTQWMKRNRNHALWPGLGDYLKEEESQFIHAVQLPNSFYFYADRAVGVKFRELGKLLTGKMAIDSQTVEGLFEIVKLNKQSFRLMRLRPVSLKESKRNPKVEGYTITGADLDMDYVETGLIFYGKISKGRINMWELLQIERAYPKSAKSFVVE